MNYIDIDRTIESLHLKNCNGYWFITGNFFLRSIENCKFATEYDRFFVETYGYTFALTIEDVVGYIVNDHRACATIKCFTSLDHDSGNSMMIISTCEGSAPSITIENYFTPVTNAQLRHLRSKLRELAIVALTKE